MVFFIVFFVNNTRIIALNSDVNNYTATSVDTDIKIEAKHRILKNRVVLAEQQLKVQNQNYLIFGGISLVIILSVMACLIYSQYQLNYNHSKKEKQLKAALLKMETQNKHQEQRLKISNDLHHTIGEQLTSIISSLDNLKYTFAINDERLKEKLKTISSFTSQASYELRDAIWAMTKTEITILDLQARILNYIDFLKLQHANIQLLFKVSTDVDTSVNFSVLKGFAIYSVIQESIQHSLTYEDVSMVKVTVRTMVSNMVFKISNNGTGSRTSTKIRGNGHNSMEKRIQSVGGELEFIFLENAGNEIIITI